MTKHTKSRWNPILFCMLIASLVCGIIGPSTTQTAYAAKKIKLSKSKITMKKGQSKKLTLKKGKKKLKKVKWKSSNKKVVSVTSSGKIKAKKAGKATITAKYKKKTYKCKVTVKKAKKKTTPTATPVPKTTMKVTKIPRKNADGSTNTIFGKLYAPKKEGKYPAIIMCHGYNGIHADFVRECTYYAQNGYVAYTFDFCGGSGRSQSTGASTDMSVVTEKKDLLAVFDYISKLDNVDSNNVFLMGGSQGGLVAALAAEEIADKIAGTILYFPAFGIPDNWKGKYSSLDKVPKTFEFWGLKLGKAFIADIWNMDVFGTIGKSNKKPVYILQGDKDFIAPLAHSQKAQKLYSNAELVIMKGQGHGFTPAAGTTAMKKSLAFMNKNLVKPVPETPSTDKETETTTPTTPTTYSVNTSVLSIPRENADGSTNTVYGKIYKPVKEGKSPAIILCHGYNGTNADFVNECNYYAKNGYVAYAFDFCGGSGRSQSTGASTDMTISTEKADLLAVFDYIRSMDIVDANQVFLMGGSQGGLVAALAAEERKDLAAGLLLYFPAFCIPDNWRDMHPNLAVVPETIDFWGLQLGREFVVDAHALDVFATIGNFSKDVLIFHGTEDAIVPLSYSQRAVELYPKAELKILNGEGHGFTPNAAKTAMDGVLAYLNSHTSK